MVNLFRGIFSVVNLLVVDCFCGRNVVNGVLLFKFDRGKPLSFKLHIFQEKGFAT